MKITFELSDKDLRYLKSKANAAAKKGLEQPEEEIFAGTKKLIESMDTKETPEFVRERAQQLHALIVMLEDNDWQLEGADRTRVLKAIAYFAEPDDIIPDSIPGLGFLDDAIMVELVVKELKHELDAYNDFVANKKKRGKIKGRGAGAMSRTEWLELERKRLQERMRRRRRRERGHRSSQGSPRLPFKLF